MNDGLRKLVGILSGAPGAAAFIQQSDGNSDVAEFPQVSASQYDLSVTRLRQEGLM